MKISTKLKKDWLKDERKRRSSADGKKAKRRYIHFDLRINPVDKRIVDVWKPDFIVGHSFFPFIRYTIESRRLKKISKTEKKIIKKDRNIDYAAHGDALIYSWYAYILSFFYETYIAKSGVKDNVTAYRKNQGSNIDFSKRVFDFVKDKRDCSVLCLDIKDFFPSLDHSILKQNWKDILNEKNLPKDHYSVYKNITKFSFIPMKKVLSCLGISKIIAKDRICSTAEFKEKIVPSIRINRKQAGIPQGSPISAILSNIYMVHFDEAMSMHVQSMGGLYQRYCDDIIFVVSKELSKKIEELVLYEIDRIKLIINQAKLERRVFNTNSEGVLECLDEIGKKRTLQYLGLEFNGTEIFIRHNGIGRYEKKMQKVVKKSQKLLIKNKRTAFAKKKVIKKFCSLKESNFVSYSNRAGDILNSDSIKRQVSQKRVYKRLKKYRNQVIDKYNKT